MDSVGFRSGGYFGNVDCLAMEEDEEAEALEEASEDVLEDASDESSEHVEVAGLAAIHERLTKLMPAEGHRNLQPADRVVDLRLAVELAHQLLTAEGIVDHSMVPMIKSWLREAVGRGRCEQKDGNLFYGLKMLQESQWLREQVQAVQAPEKPHSLGAEIIRATLGLGPEVRLTSLHAQQTVVSALLTKHLQDPSGGALVAGICSELMTSDLGRCVADWTSLLTSDGLRRQVAGQSVLIPLQLSLHPLDSERAFLINYKGLRLDKRPVVQDPGLQAIRQTLGLSATDFEALWNKAVGQLFADAKDKGDGRKKVTELMTTVDQLVGLLAGELEKSNRIASDGAPAMARKLLYLFEARTQHPLLMAWENCLANMAEAEVHPSASINKRMVTAVVKVLRRTLSDLTVNRAWIDYAVRCVKGQLSVRARHLYNTAFSEEPPGRAIRHVGSAFVLYDTQRLAQADQWIKVDTARRFQEFVHAAIEAAEPQIDTGDLAEPEGTGSFKLCNRLANTVWEESFVESVLRAYSEEERPDFAKAAASNETGSTPWVDRRPSDLDQILKVYFELPNKPLQARVKPHSSEQLLTHLIDRIKSLPSPTQHMLQNNQYFRSPVRSSGPHAYALNYSDPSFVWAWSDQRYTREWIERQLVEPGRAVARSPVGREFGYSVIHYCRQTLVREKDWAAFDWQMRQVPVGIWLCDFRDRLVSILRGFDCDQLDLVGLETAMFARLPDAPRWTLQERAVTFADGNWLSGPGDVHFAFMYNPFGDRLEIWRKEENGSFAAMDQAAWLADPSWEQHTSVLGLI